MKGVALGAAVVVAVIAAAILLLGSAYVVREDEQVVVTRFGEILHSDREAGLRFRAMPFVDTVHRFDKRILQYDGEANRIQTRGKKLIYVDTFARWRIVDPTKFKILLTDEDTARSRLGAIIDSQVRDVISLNRLVEAVRNTNRPLTQDKEVEEARRQIQELGVAPPDQDPTAEAGAENILVVDDEGAITQGRDKILAEIIGGAKPELEEYGIELIDVKIKRINYGTETDQTVRQRVYERMRSERQQIAQKYRAEGKEQFAIWKGRIEKEKKEIEAEAYRLAETIKGEADGEAARIYAEAYGVDPEFYRFYKTLELYREHLKGNSSLVVSADSELFQYLQSSGLVPAKTP